MVGRRRRDDADRTWAVGHVEPRAARHRRDAGAGPLREGLPGAAPQDGPATGSELSLPQKGVAAPGQSGSLPEGQSAPGAPVPPDMLLDFLLGP